MLDTIENLSFVSGAGLVALASVIAAFCALLARRWLLRWTLLVFVSIVLSYSLYWLPVWRGANPAEYSTWEAIIVAWALAGAVAGSVVFAAAWLMRRSRPPLSPN